MLFFINKQCKNTILLVLDGQGGHLPTQLLLDQVYKNQVADFLFDCFLYFSRSFVAGESGSTCTNLSQVFFVASAYDGTTKFRPSKLLSTAFIS